MIILGVDAHREVHVAVAVDELGRPLIRRRGLTRPGSGNQAGASTRHHRARFVSAWAQRRLPGSHRTTFPCCPQSNPMLLAEASQQILIEPLMELSTSGQSPRNYRGF